MRIASSGGVELAVYDLGGHGPPLLLCHATGFHARVWLPLAAHLKDHLHCWSVDLRGHGDSGAPADGDFHWNGYAHDALATVDALGLDRPFGMGHSKGGAALLLAEEDRPGTFRALYCYEPVVLPPAPELSGSDRSELVEGARRRRTVFDSREEAYANYASKAPLAGFHPDALRAYVEHGFADQDGGGIRLKCLPEHEARTYLMGQTHNAYDRLNQVRCPVTIAYGQRDTSLASVATSLQVAALAHGKAEAFSELGHFGPLENPAAVAASILRAFAE